MKSPAWITYSTDGKTYVAEIKVAKSITKIVFYVKPCKYIFFKSDVPIPQIRAGVAVMNGFNNHLHALFLAIFPTCDML